VTIQEAVRARLLAQPGLSDLVEERISPHMRDQDPAALPAVTYETSALEEVVDLDGPTGSGRISLQLDAWAATPDESMALALAVDGAMRAAPGNGIRAAFRRTMSGPAVDPEVAVWRVRAVYDVHYSAAVAA
jgi:hypothetical protein